MAVIDVPAGVAARVVEFSPFEKSKELLAIGCDNLLSVGTCEFESEANYDEGILSNVTFGGLLDVHHADRVCAMAWSPLSQWGNGPTAIRLSTVGFGGALRYISSDLSETTVKILTGHSGFVNDCTFLQSSEGQLLASVGDDGTCRLWDVEAGVQKMLIKLKSPGMSVCWHPSDPVKLMVSEKIARIRFYDLIAEQPIVSLDAGRVTMMSADWCPVNSMLVGATANENWHVWDLSASSQPIQSGLAHQTMGSQFRWCRQGELLFSTTSTLDKEFKLHHRGHQRCPYPCH
ncbi:nucleoporin Nup37-like isoform X2 [Corticium candelabrum]|uniref:nucleoporin Nup37-like isoform X2 n=1 Tax=Corticium candelabrum TaxID=121492 RepID=UPI002E25F448|nr:nucleoporin Nup37-like isoform X2 [Corticium candelabrum]